MNRFSKSATSVMKAMSRQKEARLFDRRPATVTFQKASSSEGVKDEELEAVLTKSVLKLEEIDTDLYR